MKKYIGSILCAIIAFVLVISGVFSATDKFVEDTLYHNPGKVDSKIRIIKIDDKTLNKYGDFLSWDRGIYAELLEKLCVSEDVKPAVVGFDILFSSEKSAEPDNRFVEAAKKAGNVVVGFSYSFTSKLETDEDGKLINNTMSVKEKILPYEALGKVTKMGFANALMDSEDSIIRSTFIYFDEEDGTRTKGFSAAVYEAYMEANGKEAKYPTDEAIMSFRYSGKPGEYESVSLCDVLDGTIPVEAFDDCIVLVGVYASGLLDSYFVPIDRGQQMYGVEIHANTIQAMMEEKTLETVPAWLDALIVAVVIALLVIICDRLSVAKTIILCASVAIVRVIAGLLIFKAGFSMNNLILPIMAILVAAYYTGMHYYKARKAKLSIERAFNKYVAPQVVDDIAKTGTYELRLGGETRDVAVLFVDIRGFTPLSESLKAEQVVEILNKYLELTTNCIFKHGGTLDKFIGDATMAVFNAPFDTDDYVYKAVLTAWDIVQGGAKLEKELKEQFGKEIGFGVGVNCGPAVVGNIGCDFRMDYTVIGDTVNTAARLESNAPKSTVYISDAVYEQLKERIEVEEVGQIPLKGKSNGVFVYSVTGVKDCNMEA